ncbi:unnamed protein product [Microthlaspi erraticum]|uniref:Myb-like domain-containing protein n=1 Tax=Microthlaspi erraticum TaxID=1685480 RepID=A0A6D2HYH2_9BRAS|nr:unnamed protein product [Microthlaspi erraticum]
MEKECYEGLLHELEDGFKGLLGNGECRKRNRATVFDCEHVEASCSESHRPKKRITESDLEDDDDDEEELGLSCVVISDESEEEDSEKEETLQGMLKWLASVARCPHNPSIGVTPHWIQVTRAKKALLVQRDNLMGHQTMHPSMYEDDRRSTGRLRYSIRRPQLSKPHSSSSSCNGSLVSLSESRSNSCRALVTSCNSTASERRDLLAGTSAAMDLHVSKPHSFSSSCNGSLVSLSESRSNSCRALVTSCDSTPPERRDLLAGTSGAMDLQVYTNAITKPDESEMQRSYVSLGRHSQAQARVDEGSVSGLNSDSKWLGTCVSPLENEEDLDDTVGKGRPDSCSCDPLIAGSVECIRLHIAEKRMELKRELGDAFFHWRFNQMGEEVALRWTEREEKRFKELMVSDPERFWENAAKNFRGKTREQLVSYYFNVFLINRRRYQNRVTPRHIDSDDEGPFGAVGSSFGRAAVPSCGSDIMTCSENSQSDDFD